MPYLPSSRRGFMGTLAALAGLATLDVEDALAASSSSEWDMSWLKEIKGKHRQVFDFGDMYVLHVVKNWLDAHETVYKLRFPEVYAIVGIGGSAFPINASDELYAKYPIGKLWEVTDPATDQPATRNPFLGEDRADGGAKVRPLQARGVKFWQCNNALRGIAGRIARAVDGSADAVYADLRAHLNPGVILVPAHTMVIGLVQERGCAYESL